MNKKRYRKECVDMREINLKEVVVTDLLEGMTLVEEFQNYCQKVLGYNYLDAKIASEDMKNPYDTPYVLQDYYGIANVEGTEYEVRFCYTDFACCGMFHLSDVEPFEFYMFIDCSTMQNKTVGEYRKAHKKYIL